MVKRLVKALGVVLAIGLLGSGTWFAYRVVASLLDLIAGLQPAEKVALLTAVVTIIGSTLAIMIGRSLEKRRELEALHRDRKIPIYDEFLTGILKGFQDPDAESFKDEKFVEFLKTWHRRLILWGGNEVVRKYAAWMLLLRNQSTDPTVESFLAFEALLRAIRKELGHSDKNVKNGVFVGFLLRQPELFYEAIRTNPKMKLSELAAIEKEASGSVS